MGWTFARGSSAEIPISTYLASWGRMEVRGKVYRVERLRRSETRGFWSGVFLVMEYLAHRYGADGVRLVVWFTF